MAEELEWELMDIFECGIFAFPIYEHNSARRIVRYLLYRGVIDEDIADAIEDSTADLHVWLNRGGKFMVGEWVIAWINETREDYYRERGIELSNHEESDPDGDILLSRECTPDSETSHEGEHVATIRRCKWPPYDEERIRRVRESLSDFFDSDSDYNEETQLRRSAEESTPPLPPRSLRERRLLRGDYSNLDLNKLEVEKLEIFASKDSAAELNASDEKLNDDAFTHPDPDSGAVSDLYSCIPSDRIFDDLDIAAHGEDCSLGRSSSRSRSRATPDSQDHLPACDNCACTLAHYSYGSSPTSSSTQPRTPHSHCDLYLPTTQDRAMDFTFDTLDQDGPGFIFIMTDSIHNCLAWNVEHRYRIASSRQPERCLLEFRARNIEIELIWQTKVTHHLKAVKEVHADLQAYNLRPYWYKCPLSTVMDAMATVVNKYKP